MTHNYPRAIDLPAPGFAAGPCLFKDTMQLAAFTENHFWIGHAAMLVNEGLPQHLVKLIKRAHGSLATKTVGILGMAFKAEVDDARDSLSEKLVGLFELEACKVLCSDPYVSDPRLIEAEELIAKSDLVVIATPHKIYRQLDYRNKQVVDIWHLRDQGRIRSIGVSNFEPEHLMVLIDATGIVPAVNQIELHPRFPQTELRKVHAQRGIATEAWAPLGQGALLTHPTVTAVAEECERTPAQVLIRWHIQLGNIVIPKSVNPARIASNFDVFDFELSANQMATISSLDDGTRLGPDPRTFVFTGR